MPAPYIKSVLEDQTPRVTGPSGVATAIVVDARKGPEETPYLITNQTQYLNIFTPDQVLEIGDYESCYQAYNLLKDSNKVYVVRAVSPDALYGGCVIKKASSTATSIAIATGLDDPLNYTFDAEDAFLLYGSSKGVFANNISVQVITDQEKVKLAGAFIIQVFKGGSLVESFTASTNPNLKNGYGVNCFIETVLEGSNYIRGLSNVEATISTGVYEEPKATVTSLKFEKGSDGSAITDADRIRALKKLQNINDITFQLIIDGGNTSVQYQNALLSLCETRQDRTYAIMSTLYEDEVNADAVTALKTYRNNTLNVNTYRGALYTPHLKVYDDFNDRYMYLAPSAFVAGAVSKAANTYGWHWPAAGYNRGILNTVGVVKKFEPTEIDELSDNQLNTIISDPGSGIVIYDQLTLLSKASDLQEQSISTMINCHLRPSLFEYLKNYIFELNDEETRSNIKSQIDLFMASEKANRAVYEYKTVCDTTNNTAADIQAKRLNIWLYIKPTQPAKFITQKIIVTPYSVNLESIEV